MPHQTLRFCPKCMATRECRAREMCVVCNTAMQPLLDDGGAISRDFLTARGTCCHTGCRNCPYSDSAESCQKICGRCGEGFECHNDNCWCGNVILSDETLKWLQRTYTDCLCPACLSGFSAA